MVDMQSPGQASSFSNLQNTSSVENAMREDRHRTVCSLSVVLNMSVSNVPAFLLHL